MINLTFHGGARTVTGSRTLIEAGGERLLIDCGLFQGLKNLRELNWQKPRFDPASVRSLVLTHAHLDHSGYLPRLVKQGFAGAVRATRPTTELARFMLLDSAHLQMEDAEFLNRKGRTKHKPALPLYDTDDAEEALKLLRPEEYGSWIETGNHMAVRLVDVGHLLGSAMAQVRVKDGSRELTILFSGDVGRYGMPINPDPSPPPESDYLVVESTYGDRSHDNEPLEAQLERAVGKVLRRGGIVIVPSFAVGRAQQILHLLRVLTEQQRLPRVPIYLDSPMALEATAVHRRYRALLDPDVADDPFGGADVRLLRTQQESAALNDSQGPSVIVSSSGMLTGGRILHHLAHHAGDARNMILIVGYQAIGTRGRALQEGHRTLRIHKMDVEVLAEVEVLHGLSGHADFSELLRWLGRFPSPRCAYVTHGEEDQALGFARRLREEKGYLKVEVPELGDRVTL